MASPRVWDAEEIDHRDDWVFPLDGDGLGDIQFLNSRAFPHGGTEFSDFPEVERQWHMLWSTWPAST